MTKIGIGIVGAGFVADIHARCYKELNGIGAEVVGIASRNYVKAEELAQRYGIKHVFTDFQSLLEEVDIHILDLCVPNYIHKDFVIQGSEAGKHVICAKPLTGYFGNGKNDGSVSRTPKTQMLQAALQDSDIMIEAAEQHHVKLMYAENWLYAPAIQKAKRLIRTSRGTIFELRAEESHHGSHSSYAKSWHYTGGGALIRLGAHPIGAVLHLKAYEGICRDGKLIRASSVLAQVANLSRIESFQKSRDEWVVRDWDDVENWATAIITFTDGSKAIVSASDVVLGGMKDTIDIFMSNARIHCNISRSNLLEAYAPSPEVFEEEYIAEKLETKAGWSFPNVSEDWALGYQSQLKDFLEAVKFDRPPISDAALGKEVVKVIYSAYISAEEGCSVDIV